MSIADKLLTIANNTPEVCRSLAPLKTVSGSVISVGDMSPIEHSLDVRLKSKNLFTNELITDYYGSTIEKTDANSCIITAKGTNPCYQGFCVEVPKSEKFTLSLNCLVENTPTNTGGAVNVIQIWKRKTTDKGHSPNVNVTRLITGASNGTQKTVSITLSASDFEGYPYMQISWYGNIHSLSEVPENPYKAILTNIQLEEGLTATAFTPYIADFSGVKITQCGKNILKYPYAQTTKKKAGITFTDNGDGTITVNGTATGKAEFELCTLGSIFPNTSAYKIGQISISGAPEDASATTYYMYITQYGNKVYSKGLKTDVHGGSFRFWIVVESDAVCENVVFKPQIELGNTITDYELYREYGTIISNADGVIEGLTSVSPNMTLIPDDAGVVIDCTYRSSDSYEASEKYTELQNAFARAKEILQNVTL